MHTFFEPKRMTVTHKFERRYRMDIMASWYRQSAIHGTAIPQKRYRGTDLINASLSRMREACQDA